MDAEQRTLPLIRWIWDRARAQCAAPSVLRGSMCQCMRTHVCARPPAPSASCPLHASNCTVPQHVTESRNPVQTKMVERLGDCSCAGAYCIKCCAAFFNAPSVSPTVVSVCGPLKAVQPEEHQKGNASPCGPFTSYGVKAAPPNGSLPPFMAAPPPPPRAQPIHEPFSCVSELPRRPWPRRRQFGPNCPMPAPRPSVPPCATPPPPPAQSPQKCQFPGRPPVLLVPRPATDDTLRRTFPGGKSGGNDAFLAGGCPGTGDAISLVLCTGPGALFNSSAPPGGEGGGSTPVASQMGGQLLRFWVELTTLGVQEWALCIRKYRCGYVLPPLLSTGHMAHGNEC